MVIETIKKIFNRSAKINHLLQSLNSVNQINIKGLYGSAKSIILTLIFENYDSNLLYITSDEEQVEIIRDDLEAILGNNSVALLPDLKDSPYDSVIHDV